MSKQTEAREVVNALGGVIESATLFDVTVVTVYNWLKSPGGIQRNKIYEAIGRGVLDSKAIREMAKETLGG